jgi:hypothetical protein
MIERRTVNGGVMAARLGGLLAPEPEAQRSSSNDDDKTAAAIDDLRRSFERQFDPTELGESAYIARVRQAQRMHLSATQRYPAYLEVGIDVWEHVYDWHVKQRQPVDAKRLPDGRYAMVFMFTTLLLRPDQAGEFVGPPYDVLPRA